MRLNQLQTFLLGCSFSVIFALMSCGKNGPKITVYLSDPSHGGMEYYNEQSGQKGFLDYSQTDKFVCLTQSDVQLVLDYCKMKK